MKIMQNSKIFTEPSNRVRYGRVLAVRCAHGGSAMASSWRAAVHFRIQWKKILSDGSYPPPPLNGNAHAWHHPKSKLKDIISNGGKLYDGKMPAFKEILSSRQEDELIAYFQHFWSDDIYSIWKTNGGLSR